MGLFRSDWATILPLVRFMETPINSTLDNTFYKVTHRSPPNFCLSRKKVVPLQDKTGLPKLGLRLPLPPQRGGTLLKIHKLLKYAKRTYALANIHRAGIRKAKIRISGETQSENALEKIRDREKKI